jgi:putative DNA primase/helicase
MLIGPTRCGKGTIVRVIRDLVGGTSAVCAPSLKNFAKDFGLEQAIGKQLALVPEVNPPREAAEIVANLKAITGGDMVTVSRKNIPNIPMLLKIKILMQSNHFVALPDNSGALHARLMLLNFTKSFLGSEDKTLSDKLEKEYPAILNWALEGLRKLWEAEGKFIVPAETQEQLDQLLAESAPLQQFIDNCCVIDARYGCQSPALYEIYREWMDQERPSEEVLSDAVFADELRAAATSIVKQREKKANDYEYEDCRIVATKFDGDPTKRARLWLGISPKAELCLKSTPIHNNDLLPCLAQAL